MKISIVGAGISGLSAAYYLNELNKKSGTDAEITVFEKSGRPGGNISTLRSGDLVIEEGADSFITSKPWAIELCKSLNIEDRLINTINENRKTYIYFDGKLNELPSGFFLMAPSNIEAFKNSSFFSESAKKRILKEQDISPKSDTEDESLKSFVERRFGNELLEKVAQPLIGGIYTGDPEKLSINAILPEFVSMEREFGSVIKGVREKYGSEEFSKRESGARYDLFVSFRKGMSVLVEAIIEAIPSVEILYKKGIDNVNGSDSGWFLKTEDGGIYESDSVIFSTRSFVTSKLIYETDRALSAFLSQIDYESSVIMNVVFEKSKIGDLPPGFGVVIPRSEGMNLIACSFSAHKFVSRVPENYEVIRCFLGGAFDKEVINKSDTEIMKLVRADLKKLFDINAEPDQCFIYRYPDSMPQYNLGYTELLKNINNEVRKYSTLAICGNAYGGVGIPDSIKSGKDAADYIYSNCAK